MRNKIPKLLSALLCIALVFTALPAMAFASDVDGEWAGWAELGSASRTLSGGSYKVTGNTTINGGTGAPGLAINGTVRLYIKSGVTLTVNGGAGSGTQGGGAGISLPGGATLKIYGAGSLVARGGNGGYATSGSAGTNSYVSGITVYLRAGGRGGNGAGAPGSGIGGNGGGGGTGGTGGSAYGNTVHNSYYGYTGSAGGAGGAGGSMGTLYVYDTVGVTATAGAKNTANIGYGGSNGSYGYVIIDNYTRAYSGGAGGGGGGQSAVSANIGGAGGGGGGGGGGASAGYVWNDVFLGGGGGGGGGGTGTAGYGGTAGATGDYYPSSSSAALTQNSTGGGYGGTSGGSGGQTSSGWARDGSRYWYGGGGWGGAGGALGASGGNGSIYCETTASINGTSGVTAIYRLTFNDQGGTGGSVSVSGISGTSLPGSVAVPTRAGFTFGGYWTGSSGSGTQYYDVNGQRAGSLTFSSSRAIFAKWTSRTSVLSVDPNGGSVAGGTAVKTYTQGYNTTLTVPTPAKSGSAFMGWDYTRGTAGTGDVLSSFANNTKVFTFGTVNAALKAVWMTAQGVDYDLPSGFAGANLNNSYNTLVSDAEYGVTQSDIAEGHAVSLKLSVKERSEGTAPNADKIRAATNGKVLQYYDFSVTKTVTTTDGSTDTELKEIPEIVKITIPIPEALRGKTGYRVYRYHDYGGGDATTAEALSNDPGAEEYYAVNGDNTIDVFARRFSTYALAANETTMTPTEEEMAGDGASTDMDVLGKVVDASMPIYKLDITWGAMTFDFNAQNKIWDPVDHVYMDGGEQGWISKNFMDGNNTISIANHSNMDVKLDFQAVPDDNLDGVTMTVNSTNSLAGNPAQNVILSKVPEEGADAPKADVYVWLTGTPANLGALEGESYTKAGVITVSVAAQPGALTPRN